MSDLKRLPTRLSVLGPPGAGKTTLSQHLAKTLDLSYYKMDDLNHELMQNLKRDLQKNEWAKGLEQILQRPRWIIDGYYSSSLVPRLTHSDLIIFVDISIFICLKRAFLRSLKNLLGLKTTAHWTYQESLWSRLDYFFSPRTSYRIVRFYLIRKPKLLKCVEQMGAGSRFVRLRSPQDVAKLMQSLQESAQDRSHLK